MLFTGSAATPSAARAAQKPSPKQLWDAYPLQPGSSRSQAPDPAPTPTAAPTRAPARPAAAIQAHESSGARAAVILLGAAVFAFVIGLATVLLLRHSRTA